MIKAGHEYGTLVEAQEEVHTTEELKAGVAAHYHCEACDTYFTEEKTATTLEELTGEVPAHDDANKDGKCDHCVFKMEDTTIPEEETTEEEETTTEEEELSEDKKPVKDEDTNSPQSGDENNVLLWANVMIFSILAVIITIRGRKKHEQ